MTRQTINTLLFIASVMIPALNNYELTFAVWSIAVFLSLRRSYSVKFASLLVSPLVILAIASVSFIGKDHSLYNIIRDITYLLKPILGLVLGYQLGKDMEGIRAFRLIILTGFLLAVAHLLIAFYAVVFLYIRNVHMLRFYAGYFNDFEMYSLAMLLFSGRFGLSYKPYVKLVMLLIMTASGFLYLARTDFILFGILVAGLMGYLRLTPRSLKIISYATVMVLVAYAIVYNMNPKRGATGFEAFMYKVKIAPVEAFKTKINENDWKDFNDNYRSFENIITVEQVSKYGPASVLFGRGLGSEVDLGRKIWSNDSEMIRYLPALHNAYMTVFLKSGIVGVLFLVQFIVLLFRQGRASSQEIYMINQLLVASAVFLILSNWVFMGLYFKVDTKAILIGFLICQKELWKRKTAISESN